MNEWFYVHGFSSPFQFQSPSITVQFLTPDFFKLGFFLHFYFFFLLFLALSLLRIYAGSLPQRASSIVIKPEGVGPG